MQKNEEKEAAMAKSNAPFIFTPNRGRLADRIAAAINRHLLPDQSRCRIFTDQGSVQDELKRPGSRRTFAVLMAADHNELSQMATMAPWFDRLPLIVMIPDRKRISIALAHQLKPRYIMWPDIDDTELNLVLRHLVERLLPDRKRRHASHPPVLMFQSVGKRCFIVHYDKSETCEQAASIHRGNIDPHNKRPKTLSVGRRRSVNRRLRLSRQLHSRENK